MSTIQIELPMERIVEFCQKWQVSEFALFGSVLREDFRPDSDIDVMVDFAPEARPTLWNLTEMEDESCFLGGMWISSLVKGLNPVATIYVERPF